MVNYLRAEGFKVTRRKYLWITLAVVAGLQLLMVGLWNWMGNGDMVHLSSASGFSMVVYLLNMGFYGTILTSDAVFSEQYKHNTLKNEVSYGLPRWRIYLGKLTVSTLASLVLCAVILAWYALLCALLLPPDGNWLETMGDVGFALLVAMPLWIGAQGLIHMLYILLKSTVAGTLIAVCAASFLGQLLKLFSALLGVANQVAGQLLTKLYTILLTTPLENIPQRIGDWSLVPQAWAVGMGWLVVTTLIGLWAFQRKEIS